jgi:hypothetical protein
MALLQQRIRYAGQFLQTWLGLPAARIPILTSSQVARQHDVTQPALAGHPACASTRERLRTDIGGLVGVPVGRRLRAASTPATGTSVRMNGVLIAAPGPRRLIVSPGGVR